MTCNNTNSNINKTFILEPLVYTGGFVTFTACTGVYTNKLISCSGNTSIDLSTGLIILNDSISVNGDVSANTFYGDGSQLSGISTDNFYTTGTTLQGTILSFNRNDLLSAYTVDLASLSGVDTTITAVTFNNNKLYLTRNDAVVLSADLSSLIFTGGSGNCITNLYATNIIGCSPLNLNDVITVDYDNSLVSITGDVKVYGSITADTYYGDGSQLSGINNFYTTGTTLIGENLYFDRNDSLSAYSVSLSAFALDSQFSAHTGNTTIHYPLSSITLSNIGDSAHTHPISEIVNLQSELDSKTDYVTFTAHTADTSVHHTLPDLDLRYVNVTGDTINGDLTVTGVISGDTGTFNSISADTIFSAGTNIHDIFITQPQANNWYVNTSGDTMTGDLTINADLTVTGNTYLQALTASTIDVSTFTGTAETLITTSGSSRLQQYLYTNSRFISDTTVIADLLNPRKWIGTTYYGTTVGLAEGQEYVGISYRYIYKDGAVTRYEMADKNISTYTGSTTIGYNNDIVLCDSTSPFTLTLIHPTGCTKSEITVKNINTGVVTLSASTYIDGASTQILTYMDSYDLYHNGSTYFIK